MSVAIGPPPFDYDRIYRTDDEAYDALAQAQNALGFPLSKKRSKANPKTGIKNRIDVRCHKSGTYRPWKHNSNQYQTSSRKTDCPFYVIIRFDKNTSGFLLEVISEQHNHGPVENPLESCRSRRQSQMHFGLERLEKIVEARSRVPGMTAKDIAEQITNDYMGVTISRHDVLCMQNKLRRNRTGAFATIQAFLDSLKDSDRIFYYASDKGPDDKLSRVFWIYHQNIEDWKRSPEILMLDNTYKINRLKMPLLQITGTTPLHTSFSAGFGLTAKEDAASFAWMLRQLKMAATKGRVPLPMVVISDFDDAALKKAAAEVFDTSEQQVCMWHILKNVTLNIQSKWVGNRDGSIIMSHPVVNPVTDNALNPPPFSRQGQELRNTPIEVEIDHAAERAIQLSWQALQSSSPPDAPPGGLRRKFLDTADGLRDAWVEVCRAETESEFWQRWAQLCYEFPNQKDIITYLHDTYVTERLQFAQFAVKWFQNYGIRMISRTKSSQLKDFFESMSTDLCQLEQHIWEMVSAQRGEHEYRVQNELGRRQAPWDEASVLSEVALKVGSKAVEYMMQHVRLAMDELQGKIPPQACSGQFRKQMGLPCRHQLLSLMKKSDVLRLDLIDRHWWLKDFEADDAERRERPSNAFQLEMRNSSKDSVSQSDQQDQGAPLSGQSAYTDAASQQARGGRRGQGQQLDHQQNPATHLDNGKLGQPSDLQTSSLAETAFRRARSHSAANEQLGLEQEPFIGSIGGPQNMSVPMNSSHRVQRDTSAITSSQNLPVHPRHIPPLHSPPPPGQPHSTHSQAASMTPYSQHASPSSQSLNSTMVHGSSSAAGYPQFSGLSNLNIYNLDGGMSHHTQPSEFGAQGLHYNFRPWHPPR